MNKGIVMWEFDRLRNEERAQDKSHCYLYDSWIYWSLTSLSNKGKTLIVRNSRKRNSDLNIVFFLPRSCYLQWGMSVRGSPCVLSLNHKGKFFHMQKTVYVTETNMWKGLDEKRMSVNIWKHVSSSIFTTSSSLLSSSIFPSSLIFCHRQLALCTHHDTVKCINQT
jgi:hypothetical protein